MDMFIFANSSQFNINEGLNFAEDHSTVHSAQKHIMDLIEFYDQNCEHSSTWNMHLEVIPIIVSLNCLPGINKQHLMQQYNYYCIVVPLVESLFLMGTFLQCNNTFH